MNAGPDVERLIAGWLAEEAPGRAPDRILESAGRVIDRTNQRRFGVVVRDLRVPWRPRTMMDRLAVAAMAAVLVIGTVAFGASLLLKPSGPAAGTCPREFSEADAIDTFAPGLSPAERAWGIPGSAPGRVGGGPIAAFDTSGTNAPLSVITIDPGTGARCRLVRMSATHVFREGDTTLDWSPTGEALAIGIELFQEDPGSGEIPPAGQVLIWTADRLVRVWLGPGQAPHLEWAPDGRSIAVWMPSEQSGVHISFADGSPDRVIEVQPGPDHLKWSPDGSRWIVGEIDYELQRTALSTVDVGDGRVSPINVGIDSLSPMGWLDNSTALVYGRQGDGTGIGLLAMPVADPGAYSVTPTPDADLAPGVAVSPDRRRLAYVTTTGDLRIVDLSDAAAAPVDIQADGDVGTSFAWSPDGSQVVFTVGVAAELWIANADGTGPRHLAAGWFPFVDPWQPVPAR
jgi:hypothetical protein